MRHERRREIYAAPVDGARMIDRHVPFPAAGLVVAGEGADGLEQRRFSRAVLANDDGDGCREGELKLAVRRNSGRLKG